MARERGGEVVEGWAGSGVRKPEVSEGVPEPEVGEAKVVEGEEESACGTHAGGCVFEGLDVGEKGLNYGRHRPALFRERYLELLRPILVEVHETSVGGLGVCRVLRDRRLTTTL